MEEEQTLRLLSVISTAYRSVELTNEEVELWIWMLREIPFETAQDNLKRHILTNRFPPTIAEIANIPVTEIRQHDLLRIETANLFMLLDQLANADKPPPDGYWSEIRSKIIMAGGATE